MERGAQVQLLWVSRLGQTFSASGSGRTAYSHFSNDTLGGQIAEFFHILALIKSEIARWTPIIQAANVKLD